MNGFKWSPLRRNVLWTALLLLSTVWPPVAWSQTLPTATQVAAQIQLGWNLGNTLEAQCGETAWGNPAVTQQFINSVKAAGFNTIRIPAAWDCHANQSTMTIDATWMARVKQVVDYAHGQGMYVILNIHWDGGWLEEHPLYSYQTAVNQKQNATGRRSRPRSAITTSGCCLLEPTKCTPTTARRPPSTSPFNSPITRLL